MGLKKTIKDILAKYPYYNADQLIEAIKEFEHVSFDMFDTLVKRKVGKPQNIFKVSADLFNKTYKGKKIDRDQFCVDRIKAETTARQVLCGEEREEVRLEEIYDFLLGHYTDSVKKELMQIEVQTEIESCHANPVMKKVYDYCIFQKKKIYIISDMYLPEEVIRKILQNCGFTDFAGLYLSSTYGYQKRGGKLFQIYINEKNLNPKVCIHLGDDWRSDFWSARKQKINSKVIARDPIRSNFTRKGKWSSLERKQMKPMMDIVNNCVDPEWEDCFCFGFECLGPMLYEICKWIHDDATKQGVKHLFFLSRDGYIMQKAYKELFGDEGIDNSYLYVSRRSLIVSQYCISFGLEEFQKFSTPNAIWTYENLAEQLGIDSKLALEEWKKVGLSAEDTFYNKHLNNDKRVVLFFQAIEKDVQQNSLQSYETILKYLAQEQFVGKVGIIDMGWRGTMQICLDKILNSSGKTANMRGYYIGLMNRSERMINAVTFFPYGYLPNLGINMLFEFFFSAPEGSTKGYMDVDNHTIIPVLYSCEYEKDKEISILQKIHAGALQFIQQTKAFDFTRGINRIALSNNLLNACRYPRKRELELFVGIRYSDKDIYRMAAPKPFRHYVRHPEDFMRDFWKAGWKIGFLKSLFKLPLPYFRMYWIFERFLNHNKKKKT